MNDFTIYFEEGWKHIISKDALDHQLFMLSLTAIYLVNNWKQVLVLVTAFTVGHSLTLALGAYDLVRINSNWVEFLIPLSILLTAASNFYLGNYRPAALRINYLLALFFGLIHGLGFANTIRFMLAESQMIVGPLLSFNLGLEAGQILVVSFVLLLSYLAVNKAGLPRRYWVRILSAMAFCWAAIICVDRWPL